MRRYAMPIVFLLLGSATLALNVPAFHLTGSASLSASLILVSVLLALCAIVLGVWRAIKA